MKKIKFYLAVALFSMALLSGCGMARDGYIEDRPAQTVAPIETPAVTNMPKATQKPEQTPAGNGTAETAPAEETPAPNAQQNNAPNM